MFPIIRHFSNNLTPVFLRTSVTPNVVTIFGLILGLVSAFLFLSTDSYPISEFSTDYFLHIIASLLLCCCYVLDRIDGEIARAKGLTSTFGKGMDEISGWLIHTTIFLAMGLSYFQETGNGLWAAFGIAAAIGATINFLLVTILDLWGFLKRKKFQSEGEVITNLSQLDKTWDKTLFIFRELFRNDFCLILLFFSLIGIPWLLLPLAAVGAQFYWIFAFFKVTRNFKP